MKYSAAFLIVVSMPFAFLQIALADVCGKVYYNSDELSCPTLDSGLTADLQNCRNYYDCSDNTLNTCPVLTSFFDATSGSCSNSGACITYANNCSYAGQQFAYTTNNFYIYCLDERNPMLVSCNNGTDLTCVYDADQGTCVPA